tara:strand:+ start:29969 stop:30268 length:300 start_codon:yes stop_codon:yes gene_type:complete
MAETGMIERVARAIWALQRDTDCNDYDKLWDGPGSAKEIARDMARAAIEAMREPTEEMCWSATDVSVGTGCEGNFTIHTEAAREAWQAMIDTLLKEEGQ